MLQVDVRYWDGSYRLYVGITLGVWGVIIMKREFQGMFGMFLILVGLGLVVVIGLLFGILRLFNIILGG